MPAYFLARPLGVFDSPLDALLRLCISHDEAMNLVRAAWARAPLSAGFAILADQNHKRQVAAVRTAHGTWQAATLLAPLFASYEAAFLALQKQAASGKKLIVGFDALA